MEFSPRRSLIHRKLYRNRMFAVTLAASSLLCSSRVQAQGPMPQYGHKPASNKGPRAIGLIQLSPKGKARLTPIAIMMDGKFYDAGSYKAAPVPMALDFGIVYEGFRSGVSQGVFTITQPGQLNHVWIAEGTWLPAGMRAPEKSKKYSTPVIEDKDAPPVLHRHSDKADSDRGSDKDSDKDKDKDKNKDKKDQQKPATPAAPPATAPPASAPSAPEAAKAPTTPETAKASSSGSAARSDEPIEDPNRPRLRRGKPDSSARREPFATFDPLTDAAPSATSSGTGKLAGKTATNSDAPSPQFTFIPAISDAGGPDPRPYTYDMKPAEEASYRSKVLALAATQLLSQASTATKEVAPTQKTASAHKFSGKPAGKLPKPDFDDVRLRIFDLSNSNQPVLVLSARTRPAAGASESFEEPKEITLIARTNLEGELKKLFFAQTDSRHLDVSPRMELIDAVDADGDGRGELLFRRTSDGGSAYAIYRVTSDHLWPLFEGTP
jgi:hypothetical protein